jgi:hypothetical protein
MVDLNKNNYKFFGESCSYPEGDEKEEKEAELYLQLWKRFLLRRLSRDAYNVSVVDEQIIRRPAIYSGTLAQNAAISMKLCIAAHWNYELDKDKDNLEKFGL